jgi:hypothetical protein
MEYWRNSEESDGRIKEATLALPMTNLAAGKKYLGGS